MFYEDGRVEINLNDEVTIENRVIHFGKSEGRVIAVGEKHVTVAIKGANISVHSDDALSSYWKINLKPVPIPRNPNALIRLRYQHTRHFFRTDEDRGAPWYELGKTPRFYYSDQDIQASADAYGHEVIFEGVK